jgi:predicted permease
MIQILALLVPFFGTIALGYGAGHFRFVREDGLAGLEFVAFSVALPALFFHLITTTPAGDAPGWAFVATTTFATYCAFALAFSIGALINGGNVPEATIEGLAGSYSNTAYLAPALAIGAFGAAAAAPTALILSFDTAMLLIITPLMMALGGPMRNDPRKLAETIARQILLNPPIVATILAFIALALGWRLPGALDDLAAFVGRAAAPVALFLLGARLARRTITALPLELPLIAAVKLVGHPLIVYLLLGWIGGFDMTWVKAAVLIAALPPAANVIGFAERYKVYGERASTAMLLGSAAAIVTVTIVVMILIGGGLPADPFH